MLSRSRNILPMNLLVLIAVLTPLLLAATLTAPSLRRSAEFTAPFAALPALAVATLTPTAMLDLPQGLLGMRLGIDTTSRIFLLLTALLWTVAGLAARAYHVDDARRRSMWLFWLLTLAGNLWLVLALDAAGFYAGFALMTFASFGLVVHTRTAEARRAGKVYLTLAVLGEAALLTGLLGRIASLGTTALPLPTVVASSSEWSVVCITLGFGVKAGLGGLHFWLPLAHPAAPTPASTVLSGAMIKAGILGWLRFLPLGAEPWPLLGQTMMTLGLVGTFGAVLLGVAQREPKTVLAYSSISQMGLITIGVGAALLEPSAWPALAIAITMYALHHGLAKGALFLGVAAIPADGSLRHWAFAVLAMPALALAGAPWTSGAVAKHLLKGGIAALSEPLHGWLIVLLPAAAVGTTLLMARFLFVVAASHQAPRPGVALPWLLSVVSSAATMWFVAPTVSPAIASALATLAAGGAIALLALQLKWRAPQLPPGDLLHWLAPAAQIAWRWLHTLAALPDRMMPRQFHGDA